MSTLQFHSLSFEVKEELARMFNEHQRDIHPYKHITFNQLTSQQKQEVLEEFEDDIRLFMRENNITN